jgi:signal transduction histidine kinase
LSLFVIATAHGIMCFMVIALNQRKHPLTPTEPANPRRFIVTLLHRQRFGQGGPVFAAIAFVSVVSALLPLPAVAESGVSENGAGRRVVVLNSTDPYLPAFIEVDRGLREAIRKHSGPLTELNAETLDMARFPGASFNDEIVALLTKKYHGLKVDVVVPLGTIALEFAELHKKEIWPGATTVFSSVPTDWLNQRHFDSGTIGVLVQYDFGPTIDLALKLLPQTRHIVAISGVTGFDQRIAALARTALERHAGEIDTKYLSDLTLAQMVAAVKKLPESTVVLYLTVFRDAAGNLTVPRDVLQEIAVASSVPVFGAFDTYIGHGIVAGSMATYYAQGRRAGELVVRVLNGENSAEIGIQSPVAPGCIADGQRLRQWGIPERLLPEGCEVRFRQFSAWERYRVQISLASIVILLQAALIAALALNRRRLQRTRGALEEEAGRRKNAETMAASLRGRLARFSKDRSLGTMATAIAHEINQPLTAIQNYAQAAKRRLQSDIDDKPKLIELFGKIEGQAERAGMITRRVRSLVNRSDMQLQQVSVAPLIEELVSMMEPEIEGRGCTVKWELAGEVPQVLADSLEIQLVLVNLVQNAMQSITSDEIYDKLVTIVAQSISDEEVRISVIDRGRGVDAERLVEVFEPLASGTDDGMGMGLAISRAIVDAHHGRLWYEPNPDGGAIFRFTLRSVRT